LYGAVFVFMLYFVLILLSILVVGWSWLSAPFFVLLMIIAVAGGKKAHGQVYNLKLSDSGLVEIRSENNDLISAKISSSSFYNSFFLYLHLQNSSTDISNLINNKKVSNSFIVIYRDAVKEAEYRLLARLINSGRD
jgi:hypothetical protein